MRNDHVIANIFCCFKVITIFTKESYNEINFNNLLMHLMTKIILFDRILILVLFVTGVFLDKVKWCFEVNQNGETKTTTKSTTQVMHFSNNGKNSLLTTISYV